MMVFERAINDVAQMFLFDSRSQQQFSEMAEEASSNSRDRFLIRITHAAFIYYNSLESQGWDISREIRQANSMLREVKRYREDRVFFTLALRMEVDVLLHQSRLNFSDAPPKEKLKHLYNEEDARALSICDTLLKNFPPSLDPLPNAWYTPLVPLFPTFQDEVQRFYGDRVKEHRIVALQRILGRIKAELVHAAGIIMAKKFLSETSGDFSRSEKVRNLLLSGVREVMARLEDKMSVGLHVASDVSLPRGISQGQLEIALGAVEQQIEQANIEKDMRKYTTNLMQMGILNFLRENNGETVKSLVNTLRGSDQIEEKFKMSRQYRHAEFSDIPFMVGTSMLRLGIEAKEDEEEEEGNLLEQSKCGLLQAVLLNPHYHEAYVNLVLAMNLTAEPGQEEVVSIYLKNFGNDITQLNGQVFKNLSLLEFQANGSLLTPEALKWLIISFFSPGGEKTKGRKMLLELKTLYILNAHEVAAQYLTAYRAALRQNDEEFIADVEDSGIHSAILFYIAHAFTSRSLKQGKNDAEVGIDHEFLDLGIELNSDSLYFNSKNNSALRLVDTQHSILQFAFKRSEKRWENINQNLSNRFQFYEAYLRENKTYTLMRERLGSLKLDKEVAELKLSQTAQLRMDGTLSTEQRDRLRNRVELS